MEVLRVHFVGVSSRGQELVGVAHVAEQTAQSNKRGVSVSIKKPLRRIREVIEMPGGGS